MYRPILEYCTPVWSPYLLHDFNKIESVQRYFTRRLFPGQQLTYTERLSLTNLDFLESRRIKFDLLMYNKIINNLVDIDSSKFFTFVHHSFNTRGHGLKLTEKLYPTNALANTFANRCINCWNALPSSIVSSPTLSHFKMQLKKLTNWTIVWANIRGEITLSVHSKWFIYWSPTSIYACCIWIYIDFYVLMYVLYIVNCDHVCMNII